MSKFIICNSPNIRGSVRVSGSKNSALPIIAASLLSDGECVLYDVPDLSDVNNMLKLIEYVGGTSKRRIDGALIVETKKSGSFAAPYEIVRKLRASFLIMGATLAKSGKVRIPLPGGCQIGARPVDLHLKGFAAMGAKITQGHGFVEARCRKLSGAKIYLDFPSVGATENILIAASLAEGQTIIENAAIEPEIVDLANFLNLMGADIKNAGCDTIRVNGVKKLCGCEYTVIPDRIEAGTFMTLAAICKGNLLIENVLPDHLKPVISKMEDIGITVNQGDTFLEVLGREKFKPCDIKTLPFPGFPTDMQAQFTALLTVVEGTSIIVETVFENRFLHVPELKRMGANIKIDGRAAVIEGAKKLTGAQLKATDLRAGAALVLAGLCAEGETEISEIEHIERGYENFENKLKALGANITKVD